jgi:hypothetical protein
MEYIRSEVNSLGALNAELEKIEVALDDKLSTEATGPRIMHADLDMNSNQILNLPAPSSPTEPVRVQDIPALVDQAQGANYIGETAPTAVFNGLRWFNPAVPTTYVWYQDSDSGQWVEETAQGVDGLLRQELAVEPSIIGNTIKAQQSIRAFDFSNILDSNGDHTAVLQAAIDASSTFGIEILLHPQTYNYSTLTLKSGMSFKGSGTDKCFLVCSVTAGGSDPILWSIKKADDGTRARNIRLENMYIGRATSSIAAVQDANPNLGGLCLAACENSLLRNLSFAAFGQGGIVFARAEGGIEGLGFTNTTQDGNYNIGIGLYFGSCGKYNAINSACWFKYKANSNKVYGIFGKGLTGSRVVGFSHANDNCIFGGTAESSLGVATFSPAAGGAVYGNKVDGMRLESCTGDAFFFDGGDNCAANEVTGGYYTGVGLLLVNKTAAPYNYIRIPAYYDTPSTSSANAFPPSSSFSTRYQVGMQRLDSVRAGGEKPLYRVSDIYNDNAKPVEVIDWSSCLAPIAGTVLATWGVRCSDSSSGGAGVNARLSVKTNDTVGNTEWLFQCGRETDGITDAVRISKTEVEILGTTKAFVMKSPDGTRYKLTPPNGGGAASWVLA